MTPPEFEARLRAAGYKNSTTRTMEPRPANGDHGHEFAVRGLVSAGEFIISRNGAPRSYTAGQIFDVAAGELHNEAVGPDGTCITTGRMY